MYRVPRGHALDAGVKEAFDIPGFVPEYIAGQVICADGTDWMTSRIERVLTNDPGMGILRHADAGYELAQHVARTKSVDVPMR